MYTKEVFLLNHKKNNNNIAHNTAYIWYLRITIIIKYKKEKKSLFEIKISLCLKKYTECLYTELIFAQNISIFIV